MMQVTTAQETLNGTGRWPANDNKLDIIVFSVIFQQAFNEPDVYETGDLPEDDQAQFESVSGRVL